MFRVRTNCRCIVDLLFWNDEENGVSCAILSRMQMHSVTITTTKKKRKKMRIRFWHFISTCMAHRLNRRQLNTTLIAIDIAFYTKRKITHATFTIGNLVEFVFIRSLRRTNQNIFDISIRAYYSNNDVTNTTIRMSRWNSGNPVVWPRAISFKWTMFNRTAVKTRTTTKQFSTTTKENSVDHFKLAILIHVQSTNYKKSKWTIRWNQCDGTKWKC